MTSGQAFTDPRGSQTTCQGRTLHPVLKELGLPFRARLLRQRPLFLLLPQEPLGGRLRARHDRQLRAAGPGRIHPSDRPSHGHPHLAKSVEDPAILEALREIGVVKVEMLETDGYEVRA